MRFYADFLYKFEPMSIKNGSVFAKEGTSATEVFFLLNGCVECVNQNKYFLEGTVFGETDVVLNRQRYDTYKARGDCYILKIRKNLFDQIIDEFPDFREEIQKMVSEREKNRLEKIQQNRLRKEMQEQFSELNKLVEQIDFQKISEVRDAEFMFRTRNNSTESADRGDPKGLNNEPSYIHSGYITPMKLPDDNTGPSRQGTIENKPKRQFSFIDMITGRQNETQKDPNSSVEETSLLPGQSPKFVRNENGKLILNKFRKQQTLGYS
jgi:CRP-like cAMP-binding protein